MPTRKIFEQKPDAGAKPGYDWLSAQMYRDYSDDPSDYELESLEDNYLYRGEAVYAGFNFNTREAYDVFLKETENGTVLKVLNPTKFTAERKIATTDARNGKYMNYYYGDRDDSEPAVRQRNVDHMHGKFAVVVRIETPLKTAFSAEKLDNNGDRGSIVVLLKGTYKIRIVETLEPFKKTVDESNFKEKFMSIKSIGTEDFYNHKHELDFDRTLFKHILKHYEAFDYEMSGHLYTLIRPILDHASCDVYVGSGYQSTYRKAFDTSNRNISISWTIPTDFLMCSQFLNGSDHREFDERLIEMLRTVNRVFREKTADVDWHHNEVTVSVCESILLAVSMEDYEEESDFFEYLSDKMKLTAQRLNSYEETKRINRIHDMGKKRDAINSNSKRMKNALDQIIKLNAKK